MYKYYNANVKNNNVTDCFIRALSSATNRSWDEIYEKISDIAQWNGTTMDNRDFILEYLDRHYERLPKFHGTIKEASDYYNDNVILITTLGHIVCSKFGIIYDVFDPSDKPVEFIWLVR